jgi:hypothetical protein
MNTIPTLGFGIGLREPHYEEILQHRPAWIDWLEIISENFMEMHGGYTAMLQDLRADYPIVMHGVALSIGSTDPLDQPYLAKLKSLAEAINPAMISDHLCFTGVGGVNMHDLLPVPLTEEALEHIIPRIQAVQEFLGRRLFLENPSSYLEFEASTIPEWEFLVRLQEATGCGLLLDVNNIYVSSVNHGFDPYRYMQAIPAEAIGYVHLAGHCEKPGYLFDTHDHPVSEEVWQLYRATLQEKGQLNSMVEWDSHIPPLASLRQHLAQARSIAAEIQPKHAASAEL